MKLVIPIEPMGAVRMTQRSKFVNTLAQRYLNYKKFIAYEAKQHMKDPIDGAISVDLVFTYPVPESWSNKKRMKAFKQELLPQVKPDIDNVIKGVFDALNGIAWKDDNRVVSVVAHKRYGITPQIDITISEVAV